MLEYWFESSLGSMIPLHPFREPKETETYVFTCVSCNVMWVDDHKKSQCWICSAPKEYRKPE